jgi:DNA-directed RNA polymerase specialized sigma24 family protein
MQEAFLKLWERWDRIDTIDDPVAYLFSTALNGFRMRARHAPWPRGRSSRPPARGTRSTTWR